MTHRSEPVTRPPASPWVRQLIEQQHADGSWGSFHSLGQPTGRGPVTTEQALRRLLVLGLTAHDEPVHRALEYIRRCLSHDDRIPDRPEKVVNWEAFESLMLATWLRLFVPEDPLALPVAETWAEIVSEAFANGGLDPEAHVSAYRKHVPRRYPGERVIGLAQFYVVNLVQGTLDADVERSFVDHLTTNDAGIHYVYDQRIADLPEEFASRRTSRWLAALEILAAYPCAAHVLGDAAAWLRQHQVNGMWDLGPAARDGVHFPLSASWRDPRHRREDCTARIQRLLTRIGQHAGPYELPPEPRRG